MLQPLAMMAGSTPFASPAAPSQPCCPALLAFWHRGVGCRRVRIVRNRDPGTAQTRQRFILVRNHDPSERFADVLREFGDAAIEHDRTERRVDDASNQMGMTEQRNGHVPPAARIRRDVQPRPPSDRGPDWEMRSLCRPPASARLAIRPCERDTADTQK